ncbi:MAG TPA: hypothetical protein VGJ05_21395 [Fimbriiglobus sp.]
MTPTDPTANLRRTVYLLLGTAAVAIGVAKIVGAENVFEPSRYAPPTAGEYGSYQGEYTPTRGWPKTRPEPTPMFGSNDRSRWATVRALVENGTYVIGRRDNFWDKSGFKDSGIVFEDDYRSIDKVMNPDSGEFFSSKPPILATLLAGEYWVLHKLFGWSIDSDRWLVIPTILLTVNVIPFVVYLCLLACLCERFGTTDFGKLLAFATGCLGTFLTTFSVTLNNHSPAAYCCLFAIYPLLFSRDPTVAGVTDPGMSRLSGRLFASGFFAGCTAAFELPATSLAVALFVVVLLWKPKQALLFMLPGMLIPVGAFFATNYAALGRFMPAYGEFGGPWYEFEGSHWARHQLQLQGVKQYGIDFAQESRTVYAFHCLFGHHGWFSLTPVWLVGLIAIAAHAKRAVTDTFRRVGWTLPMILALTAVLTLTLFVFYVYVQKTNNYGGNTAGLRWFFWLTPLWLIATLKGGDAVAGYRSLHWVAAGLFGLSVLSVFYPAWNAWRSPWILQLCEYVGWVRYG